MSRYLSVAGLLPTKGFRLYTNSIKTDGTTFLKFSLTAYSSLHAKIMVSFANYTEGSELTLLAGAGVDKILSSGAYVLKNNNFDIYHSGLSVYVKLSSSQTNNMLSVYANVPYTLVDGINVTGFSTINKTVVV